MIVELIAIIVVTYCLTVALGIGFLLWFEDVLCAWSDGRYRKRTHKQKGDE